MKKMQRLFGTTALLAALAILAAPCPPLQAASIPEAPVLSAHVSGTAVTFSWNAVADAQGYTLVFRFKPYDWYFWQVDAGNVTSLTSEYPLGTSLYAAVQTYNEEGKSGYSNIVFFQVTTPSGLQTTRDDRGVWFIAGPEDEPLYNVFEAMGYAVATDRLWQAETYRRQARGRLSEILGSSLLGTDIYFRTIFYSQEELQAIFNGLTAETKDVINGYVAGFNRRIAEVRNDLSLLPLEFAALGFVPEDWSYLDVLSWLAILQRLFDTEALDTTQIESAALYLDLMEAFPDDYEGMFDDLRCVNDPAALTYIPPEPTPAGAPAGQDKKRDAARTARAVPDLRGVAEQMSQTHKDVVDSLKKINAYVKLGSYAWTVSGSKTESGNPIVYSGPQMGFSVPSIVLEGSIRAGGLDVSGMSVTGVPFIIIGRTPHHAWSMQVGCAHTVDYYLEDSSDVTLHRVETFKVAGQQDVQVPIYRSAHGPVVSPMPYDPSTYDAAVDGPIVAWKYSQWGYEATYFQAGIDLARAASMDEFGAAIENVNFSIHYCYADRDGNIAYWMAGRDPVRPEGEWRLPQGFIGEPLEWDSAVLITRSTDRNASKGFYSGWNNKSRPDYDSGFNSAWQVQGPFHIAHAIDDYLSNHNRLTYEEVRDLALNIATTDWLEGWGGGNPWKFVAEDFTDAVLGAELTVDGITALLLLYGWDGHFVAGGEEEWAEGTERSEAWILMSRWIDEVIRMTFEDELGPDQDVTYSRRNLFNVLLHALAGSSSSIVNNYDWFQNASDPAAPQTADDIIVQALDNALSDLGPRPWSQARGETVYVHDLLGEVWRMPFSNRSTYAHVVEYGTSGPVRIESMFPLGESGTILADEGGNPVFDDNFFSMTPFFDVFEPRDFPLFE